MQPLQGSNRLLARIWQVNFSKNGNVKRFPVTSYEMRFSTIELKIEGLRGDVRLTQWMVGLLIAGVASLVVKAFS